MKLKLLSHVQLFVTPMDYTACGILQARILEWVAVPFSRGSSQLRDQTQVFHIAGWFFTSWATREAQETGVGSLTILQRIFLTQESNQGLLHCRWILYQLNYQGRPLISVSVQFSCSVVSDSWQPHESQHARPPCPSPTPGVHSDSRPSSQWCHPSISISVW